MIEEGTSRAETDVLVVGSGIAGLTFALRVAAVADVTIVTKKTRPESSTNFAQGGIAAAVGGDDSPDLHQADTLRAGAGLCHHERVQLLVEQGPAAVRDLMDWGVRFSLERGRPELGMEAGHSRRRIVHSRDRTGLAIETALLQAVAAHPRIHLLEDHMATRLRVLEDDDGRPHCVGAWVLDAASSDWIAYRCAAVLLATGGCGALYSHTTNPGIATGDGTAMAFQAGAVVANMEFMQFHPTALHPAHEQAFLISEAVRGEGAVLRNAGGSAFMKGYDPRGDLAPRDIVARAVHRELRESGDEHVWLDATHLSSGTLESRFPNILRTCLEQGIDIRKEAIPVVPAAHYACGGVWTDRDAESTVDALFAAGECACTGVHGANRLASNSLLEAVVFAERAAVKIAERLRTERRPPAADDHDPPFALNGTYPPPSVDLRRRLGRLVWDRLGIVRDGAEMEAARRELDDLRREWSERSRGPASTSAAPEEGATTQADWISVIEMDNLLCVADLIARSATWRRESRGLHYDLQCPYRDNEWFLRDTLLRSEAVTP